MSFNCIDCFCGAGGLALGLSNSGFDILWGSGVVPIYPRYSALKILKKICEKNLQLQIKALTLHCDCDAK